MSSGWVNPVPVNLRIYCEELFIPSCTCRHNMVTSVASTYDCGLLLDPHFLESKAKQG